MKFALCFLATVSCAVALPAEIPFQTPAELDLSKLKPMDIFLEPINPVQTVPLDLPGSRVIGGSEVTPNSIPYQVALLINGVSLCGGSLISTTRVLTAAHCTDNASFVEVRFGAHRFNTNEATQVRITSTNIVSHESYNIDSFLANDIAVIFLPSAVTLNTNIGIISLAPATAGTYEGSAALLTGWGRTTDISLDYSPVLLGVNLSVIDNTACSTVYGSSVLSSNICTVGGCGGDSGGPLVVGDVQVGIVSFGSVGCEFGNPTVFARISSFRNWISQNAGV